MAVCDNGQTAVARPPKLRVAHDVTPDTGDRACRSPRALRAKDILGRPCEAVADVGYDPGEDVKTCLDAGSTPSLARPRTAAPAKLGLFSKEDGR
jgi:hypothetical protein